MVSRFNSPLSSFTMVTVARLELLLMQLFILINALNIASASQCSDIAHAAVSELTKTGTSWIHCNVTDGTCLPEGTYKNDTVIAQCINFGGVKACGIDGGQIQHHYADSCGIYVGSTASRFASLLSGTATSPLPIDIAAWHILVNWPNLGYVNILVTCCSATSCYIRRIDKLGRNYCNPGYSTVKCAGDEHHGVCSTWNGDGDSGQYFLVNADAPLPPLAAIVNPSSTSSTSLAPTSTLSMEAIVKGLSSTSSTSLAPTPTLSIGEATASPSALSARRGETVPAWAIALICVLGLAVLALSLLFARHVRARRKIDRDQSSIGPASPGPRAIDPLIIRPMGVSPDAQVMSGGDGASQEALSPPRYAKAGASY